MYRKSNNGSAIHDLKFCREFQIYNLLPSKVKLRSMKLSIAIEKIYLDAGKIIS